MNDQSQTFNDKVLAFHRLNEIPEELWKDWYNSNGVRTGIPDPTKPTPNMSHGERYWPWVFVPNILSTQKEWDIQFWIWDGPNEKWKCKISSIYPGNFMRTTGPVYYGFDFKHEVCIWTTSDHLCFASFEKSFPQSNIFAYPKIHTDTDWTMIDSSSVLYKSKDGWSILKLQPVEGKYEVIQYHKGSHDVLFDENTVVRKVSAIHTVIGARRKESSIYDITVWQQGTLIASLGIKGFILSYNTPLSFEGNILKMGDNMLSLK